MYMHVHRWNVHAMLDRFVVLLIKADLCNTCPSFCGQMASFSDGYLVDVSERARERERERPRKTESPSDRLIEGEIKTGNLVTPLITL